MVPIPEKAYGTFFEGDCYIILHVSKAGKHWSLWQATGSTFFFSSDLDLGTFTGESIAVIVHVCSPPNQAPAFNVAVATTLYA